ncbi:unnamed protein product [Moneuplotes crassus]|uniref:Mitochondrial import inner membrane translocase subunit n=1 Tax=Euplotes crassus TaxID=5936 RepID=A0AAD1Y9E7_EUPCR|nr:unnamed protein product [Moneuplotes crassus]
MASKKADLNEVAFMSLIDQKIMNNLSKTCTRMCISDYENEEIALGEANCLNRCTYKYSQLVKMSYIIDHGSYPLENPTPPQTWNV